jgi:steroid 5-alpha reductase family enzyme
MTLLYPFGVAALAIWACMTLLWLVSLRLQDASIVDAFWGTGFVIVNAIYAALTPGGLVGRRALITVLVTVWGLRLSAHILRRNWGRPEDPRYHQWREEEGARWWWLSYLRVFLLQGGLICVISAPLLAVHASASPAPMTALDLVAIALWSVGFFFEAVGDAQLARFKANPANQGQVLDRGVWRYTRHPNYFGDATQWWAYYLIALAGGGWWTVFSPVLMTWLLLRVSGVAMLEKSLKQTKPQYEDYINSTSAFIPWFPRE